MSSPSEISSLQKKIWAGSIPLEIRLASSECRTFDQSDPYLVSLQALSYPAPAHPHTHPSIHPSYIHCESKRRANTCLAALKVHCPRLSYLPALLPRLRAFFAPSLINPDVRPSDGWLACQGVPLKWHLPVGLLYDLYSGAEPAAAAAPGRSGAGKRGEAKGPAAAGRWEGERADGGEALPWRLVVRFAEWPDEQLVRLDAEGRILHDAFINSVKEVRWVGG